MTYKFPYLNPIRFHQYGVNDFFYNEIPGFEVQRGWVQPYVMGDRPYLQIHGSSPTATMTMRLIDNEGTVYKTWGVYYSGYSYGLTETTYVYQWGNPFPYSSQISEGIYFLKLEISDTEGSMIFYSEPIKLTALAPDNTVRIIYTHDENDFDVIFTGSNIVGEFMLRIDGGMKSEGFLPGGKFTMFQDLDYNSVMLQSQPYNIEKWTFGPANGCPNWMGDKINRIFGLSDITIDGVGYSRNENAKIDRAGESGYPLAGWTIELVKTANPYKEEFSIHTLTPTPLTCDSIQYTCDSTLVTSDMTEI